MTDSFSKWHVLCVWYYCSQLLLPLQDCTSSPVKLRGRRMTSYTPRMKVPQGSISKKATFVMGTLPRYGCSRRHGERSWLRDNSGEIGGTGCWEMEKKNRTILRWETGRSLGKNNRDLSPGGFTSLKNLTETLVPTRNKVVSVHDLG